MAADWSRLVHYPHYDDGPTARKRYAERQAFLTRLNGMEGIFERLQNGKNLGTKGAARTRIRDKGAHETIISLALMSMTAATLADQREQHGEHHDLPPAKPAPRRPRKRAGRPPKKAKASSTSQHGGRQHRRAGQRGKSASPAGRSHSSRNAATVAPSNGGASSRTASDSEFPSSWDEALALAM